MSAKKAETAKAEQAEAVVKVPQIEPAAFLPRVKQVQWDHYYMEVALTIRKRANCLHARVGAVLVLDNRIISTGFNGTPAAFPNCTNGGCERCRQQYLADHDQDEEITIPELAYGAKHLDLCVCVHAEANALVSAARFGNRTEGSVLYATHKPCFSCLKEAYQAGVGRIVWLKEWEPSKNEILRQQYELLAEHLRANDARNFEQLQPQRTLITHTGTKLREPVLDDKITDREPDEPVEDGETPLEFETATDEVASAKEPVRKPESASKGTETKS